MEDYLTLLAERTTELLTQDAPATYPVSLTASIQIALDRLVAQSPAALQLLTLAAYLAPEPIPLTLFTTHSAHLPNPLATAAADPLAFTTLTRLLRQHGLAQLEQRGEHRDLVGFRADLDLAQDQLLAVGCRGQQMGLVAFGVDGSAHGFAVHRDRYQRRFRRFPPRVTISGSVGAGLRAQPGADRSVHRGCVGVGEHPPQRRLRGQRRRRRGPGGSTVELGQQLGRYIGDPPGDRGERAHTGQHRRRAQGEHDRDRVIPALIRAPVGHTGEALQQVNAFQRGNGQISVEGLARRRVAQCCRVGLGDDRMNQQRSTGVVARSL